MTRSERAALPDPGTLLRAPRPAVAAFALLLVGLLACSGPAPSGHGSIDSLRIEDTQPGEGALAETGMRVTVHYTGWLYDDREPDRRGEQFDSSRERGRPFTFLLGAKQVIRGWDEGVQGMRVGGKRMLWLPSLYGYGPRGAGSAIGPDASLVFEVELLAVEAD
ncbi:FKBP-type peptidyl-prolyl cis-trans isomerase [Pseudomarimonas salicorniae]|uniref:Peptidyl-prolyl cis-trans isomerase n=1 Tax=Pseudomarimonas salicorniae TaxID=2933270 RepID=A0ABT0GHW5_9GAMM|nr:FKBP-type peptidyl-prolyl cis-trans isomerase [Lysobacter sp. CAU 1642]MCK7594136.1 FKBP-type peptidyl-prolyl cis-trans isomerase [Lysobacter sp. CAU 1642]